MAVLKPRCITTPVDEKIVRSLKLGEKVLLSGQVFTARDRLHKYVFEGGRLPVSLKDGAVFHCGPVIVRQDGVWQVKAAGPTTSIREEPYMARFIAITGIRLIIGKGGMGPSTRAALTKHGCAYLSVTGGAAQVLAARVVKVRDGFFVDSFGMTEALWDLEVRDLPAVVTIDAAGQSLHARIEDESTRACTRLFAEQPAGTPPRREGGVQ